MPGLFIVIIDAYCWCVYTLQNRGCFSHQRKL